jgi:hypothetical protein
MFAQKVAIHFVDGTEKSVTLTQWSIGQFAQYAQNKGWNIDPQNPGLLAVTMLRFQAFAELHRDPNKPKVQFDKWDMTVSEVEPEEGNDGAVDPTQSEPSGG